MPKGILALDIATTTGYAFAEPGGVPEFKAFRAVPPVDAGGDGDVYVAFERWLNELIDRLDPAIVVFESPYLPRASAGRTVRSATGTVLYKTQPAQINMHTIRRLLVLCGIAEKVAAERRLICREEDTRTIQKTFTGYGGGKRVEKKAAVMRVCRLYGWNVTNDNEADALALLVSAEAILFPMVRRSTGTLFASTA